MVSAIQSSSLSLSESDGSGILAGEAVLPLPVDAAVPRRGMLNPKGVELSPSCNRLNS